MVWRQLPKLIPAGSIPVSRSKRLRLPAFRRGAAFCIFNASRTARLRLRGIGTIFARAATPRGHRCRFAYKNAAAPLRRGDLFCLLRVMR